MHVEKSLRKEGCGDGEYECKTGEEIIDEVNCVCQGGMIMAMVYMLRTGYSKPTYFVQNMIQYTYIEKRGFAE